jgi:hypothetical protein
VVGLTRCLTILMAVTASSNRAKGEQDPAEWMTLLRVHLPAQLGWDQVQMETGGGSPREGTHSVRTAGLSEGEGVATHSRFTLRSGPPPLWK